MLDSLPFPMFRRLTSVMLGSFACGAVSAIATTLPVEALDCSLSEESANYCLLSENPSPQQQTLRVGVAGSAPFIVKDEDNIQGISLDVWKFIASVEKLDYELITYPNVTAGLDAVAQGQLDVLIGPISVTPQRLAKKEIEFTRPYFISQFGLLLPAKKPTVWSRVAPLFGIAALSSITLLIVLIFIVGNLIWLAERRSNPEQFPPNYGEGVRNGIWFALVTLTTVGYGDRTPVSKAGQLIAGIWMVVTLVTVSSLTAGLASALTAVISGERARERFRTHQDLTGARIAVVADTASVKWAKDYQVISTESQTLEEAINLMVTGQVDGVIFDHPVLKYYVSQHPELNLRVSPLTLGTDTYSFVLPTDNDLLMRKINILVLELRAELRVRAITEKWLAAPTSDPQ
ncbi:MAG: transporter substrate-binding domain-containing protein [Microcystaceae cyanobacterium]